MSALAVVLIAVLAAFPSAPAVASMPEPPEPPPVTANEFYPAERDLSDCLSALPKPGCGSEARGGMHQTAVFAALMLGLAVIGTRIVVGIRRRDRPDPDRPDPDRPDPDRPDPDRPDPDRPDPDRPDPDRPDPDRTDRQSQT